MKKTYTISADPEVIERAKKVATDEKRSLSNLIEVVLSEYCDQKEQVKLLKSARFGDKLAVNDAPF